VTYLFLSLGEDGVDVLVGDFAVLAGKHVAGPVPDHVQHLVLAQLVSLVVHQPTCNTATSVYVPGPSVHDQNHLLQ